MVLCKLWTAHIVSEAPLSWQFKMLQLHGTLLAMAKKDLLLNLLFCYGGVSLRVILKVYPLTVCPITSLYHITPSHMAPLHMQAW